MKKKLINLLNHINHQLYNVKSIKIKNKHFQKKIKD